MATIGLNALGGMEYDFECAGMCAGPATFYTFSDVAMGVPTSNCSIAFEKWLNDSAPYLSGCLWTFGILTAICAAFVSMLFTRKTNDIDTSPLLSRIN